MLAAVSAVLALAVALFAPPVLGDGDTYLHIAAGDWMLAHRAIPHFDPFSATYAGHPWVAHEWLSEALTALAWRAAGWRGVLTLTAIAVAAAFWQIGRALAARLPGRPAALLCLAAGAAVAPSLLARPHILALPLLVAWTVGLLDAVEGPGRPPWRLLPLLTLWANLHGGFIVGPVLAAGLAAEAVLRGARLVPWTAFLAAAVLACCLTPNATGGLLLPFHLVAVPSLSRVGEWRPTDLTTPQPLDLLVLGLAYLGLAQRLRLPPVRLILVAGLLAAALAHTRNQLLAGVIGTLLVAGPLARNHRQSGRKAGRIGWAVLGLALILVRLGLPVRRGDDAVTPGRALAAVGPELRRQPVLNAYAFGPYLIFEGIHPFIDTRVELYGDAFLRRYGHLMESPVTTLSRQLDAGGIAWTLLAATDPAVARLDTLPGWRRCFADATAVVHVRRATPASACPTAQPPAPPAVDQATADIPPGENDMDKDRVGGMVNQAKGVVKEATGKVAGDTKLEAEGKAQKVAGKVQNAAGGAKDAVRDASKT